VRSDRLVEGLEVAGGGDDVLLVDRGRDELEPVEPDHALEVVGVRPEGVEDVVGSNGDVRVVTEEPATEPIPGVDRVGADVVRDVRRQVPDPVIQPRVVESPSVSQVIRPGGGGGPAAHVCQGEMTSAA
jgi:hypothetical protein